MIEPNTQRLRFIIFAVSRINGTLPYVCTYTVKLYEYRGKHIRTCIYIYMYIYDDDDDDDGVRSGAQDTLGRRRALS